MQGFSSCAVPAPLDLGRKQPRPAALFLPSEALLHLLLLLTCRCFPLRLALAGETTLVWDRSTGQPLHNAIVWLDNRTSGVCHAMAQQLGSQNHFRPGEAPAWSIGWHMAVTWATAKA